MSQKNRGVLEVILVVVMFVVVTGVVLYNLETDVANASDPQVQNITADSAPTPITREQDN